MLIYETLVYLLTRGTVRVCLPVARHLQDAFVSLRSDPALAAVRWHPFEENASASRITRGLRVLAPAPVEVQKFLTPANLSLLSDARRLFNPSAELLISSRVIAACSQSALPANVRLYMLDIDPRIIRYDGPSWPKRLATAIERLKVDRLCRKALAYAGRVGAISQADVPELNRMRKRDDVRHVPPLMRPQPADRQNVDKGHVLITTNFGYQPNVAALRWFLQMCWPHVDSRASLTVTGIDVGDSLKRLCEAHERVTYAGCLPRPQLDAMYGRVSLAVNPTRSGSGFQIKLLDALARGVPIVSTAFSNRVGAAIASSDDPVELARLINARLIPGATPTFDYTAFYETAIRSWDSFLFE
ncbi:MAG: glycosyltransferase [Pirellulales bacterium]